MDRHPWTSGRWALFPRSWDAYKPVEAGASPEVWLEWGFVAELNEDRELEPLFVAGVSVEKDLTWESFSGIEPLTGLGFRKYEVDGYPRLFRVKNPLELLGDVESQIDGLAVWVIEAFQAVISDGLPTLTRVNR